MLKLYGAAKSINVRKVLWTCDELQRAVDHVHWDDPSAMLKSAPFVAINPNALAPIVDDDGFVLWESNAICRYLVGCAGRGDLLPEAPQERAIVEQWMDWQATELNNAWRYAFLARVRRSPAHADPAQIDASVAAWNRHMTILDGRLARTGAYVAGASFTLADVVLGLAAHRWTMTPIDRASLPHVADWLGRLAERPGYRRHAANGLP